MKDKRIVISGIGLLSGCGIGKERFWDSIFGGVSGIKPISLFDTSGFNAHLAAEIKDFSPQEFLGAKGLRNLDRTTKLIMSAAKLSLDDGQMSVSEENAQDIGIVVGSTLGSVASICDFDTESITEGPNLVNPALFPNTVINAPASQVSIKFNIKGFNTTISTGFTAGLDAIGYGVDMLRFGRARIVLAGGVEGLSFQTFLGFYKSGCLSGSQGKSQELCVPFDKRRNGVILGEGAGLVVLEEHREALARKARIYGEVLGFGTGFDSRGINQYNLSADGLKQAMAAALREADIGIDGVDYICAGAHSSPQADALEATAIKEVFGKRAHDVMVGSIKSLAGESLSASGVLQVAAAAGAIEKQKMPPIIGYKEKDPACDLNYVLNASVSRKVERVLINNFGPGGNNSSLVIAKFVN